jgi:hypothetical protein
MQVGDECAEEVYEVFNRFATRRASTSVDISYHGQIRAEIRAVPYIRTATVPGRLSGDFRLKASGHQVRTAEGPSNARTAASD